MGREERDATLEHLLTLPIEMAPLPRLPTAHPSLHESCSAISEMVRLNRPSQQLIHAITWGICTRRAGKLYKARSRLYRSQILQVNTRWKALAEIYTMQPLCTVLISRFCC